MNEAAKILSELLEPAKRNSLTEVFVVFREEGQWGELWFTEDAADMLFNVESAKIRARIAAARND